MIVVLIFIYLFVCLWTDILQFSQFLFPPFVTTVYNYEYIRRPKLFLALCTSLAGTTK